jgi:hypothetical protein
MYFQHMYEYGTWKPVKVILRRRKRKEENDEGDKPNRIICTCTHIWKCHNETSCTTIIF